MQIILLKFKLIRKNGRETFGLQPNVRLFPRILSKKKKENDAKALKAVQSTPTYCDLHFAPLYVHGNIFFLPNIVVKFVKQ